MPDVLGQKSRLKFFQRLLFTDRRFSNDVCFNTVQSMRIGQTSWKFYSHVAYDSFSTYVLSCVIESLSNQSNVLSFCKIVYGKL